MKTWIKTAGLVAAGLLACWTLVIWQNHRNEQAYLQRLKKPAPGPDPRPHEWFWLQRTWPHDAYDLSAYSQALEQRDKLAVLRKQAPMAVWQFVGPSNIGGRIVDVEFDPLNPDIVYAGAATGGVFKSTDGGYTWFPVFDDQAVLTVGDICLDPKNPQIVFVGTGEANGGHNNFPGAGVYKSTDGGLSWRFSGLENSAAIGRIRIDPLEPRRVFVAAVGSYFAPNSERGVFLSEDGGETWNPSLFVSDSTGAIDLVMDEENPDFMLAAMWERVRRPVSLSATHLSGPTSGIYRTRDGGKTWQLLGPETGLPDSRKTAVGRIGLALFPDDTRIAYALYTDGTRISGLFRTDDGGDSWRALDPNRQVVGTGSFSWYFGQIRVHPTDADRVFALDIGLNRSADGGASWPIRYSYGGYPDLHVDHHALAFHPNNPDFILDGNDGGINWSADGGVNWVKVDDLPVTQFYEIGLDAQHPERAYGGTQDNGTLRTLDGRSEQWEQIWGGDGFFVVVDPTNPDVIYAESQFGYIVKSMDGGSSFSSARRGIDPNEPTNWSTPLVMDPSQPTVLYTGTNRLYRSDNGAESWQAISDDLSRGLADSRVGTVTAISVAPSHSEVIYAGTDDGWVWVTLNEGRTWDNVSEGLPFRWVTEIATHPQDPAIVVVSFSGLKWKDPQPHLFLTRDAGLSWQDISADLPDAPVNSVLIDPLAPQRIYAATDVGVFVSPDFGGSWAPLDAAMPVVVCYDLKFHPVTAELFVGTHGRSMYKIDTGAMTAVQRKNDIAPVTAFVLLPAYPNPFNAGTRLTLEVRETSQLLARIIDSRRRLVRVLLDAAVKNGTVSIEWNGLDRNGLPVASGLYFFQVSDRNSGFHRVQKLACIR
ncbi:hypothetical protein JW992_06145 [candidate division KSB1 bacterium]|nr:hypothetical protein [candidate division KSB1 bacterium]